MLKVQRARGALFRTRKQADEPPSHMMPSILDKNIAARDASKTSSTSSTPTTRTMKQGGNTADRERDISLSKLVEAVRHEHNVARKRRVRSESVSNLTSTVQRPTDSACPRSASDAELISLNAGWNAFLVFGRTDSSQHPIVVADATDPLPMDTSTSSEGMNFRKTTILPQSTTADRLCPVFEYIEPNARVLSEDATGFGSGLLSAHPPDLVNSSSRCVSSETCNTTLERDLNSPAQHFRACRTVPIASVSAATLSVLLSLKRLLLA
ncbi:hypothetical protein EW145_g6997 [Phellinidium pouzarii]|uniref:Uncharacterized protein n=1 Tax=Phellinidium pouzarii TaxID=167371 RepID=A0A4S4KVE6_9AGAM|nr:hypothetical protein EW145_g6997 [Phellinidium pouzarii]